MDFKTDAAKSLRLLLEIHKFSCQGSYLYALQNLDCFLFTCARIISPVAASVLTRVWGVGTGTGSVAMPRSRSRTWTRPRTRPELGDHLHHIGHGHLAGAHGLKALGERTVRVLLNV